MCRKYVDFIACKVVHLSPKRLLIMSGRKTANLFQDNREDVSILQREEGIQRIVELHVEAIKNYVNEYDL